MISVDKEQTSCGPASPGVKTAPTTQTQEETHPDASMDVATDGLDIDIELDATLESESEYMLVSCRDPMSSAHSRHKSRGSSAGHSNVDLDIQLGSSQNSTATPTPQQDRALSLRLVFPSEDGGVLIGKNGRHINKLKETTAATWLISSGNALDDRIVTISGSVSDIASAVRALAQHILSEKALASPKDAKPSDSGDSGAKERLLTLNMLFPARCIGYILGPGGSRVGDLRQKCGVSWLHVSTNTVPFTQERVVQASATAQGLETVAAALLHSTKIQLLELQGSSTLYKPVQNGLQAFLDFERRSSNSGNGGAGKPDPHGRKRLDNIFIERSVDSDRGRKRARSMVETNSRPLPRRDALADGKRPRRMSENSSSDRRSRQSQNRRSSPPATHRSGSSRSTQCSSNEHRRSSHSSGSSGRGREEKLVVPDLIVGRLIGRNGAHLESLKAKSGAEIRLSPRVKDMRDRVVTVSGSADKVRTACKLINESVRAFEDLEA